MSENILFEKIQRRLLNDLLDDIPKSFKDAVMKCGIEYELESEILNILDKYNIISTSSEGFETVSVPSPQDKNAVRRNVKNNVEGIVLKETGYYNEVMKGNAVSEASSPFWNNILSSVAMAKSVSLQEAANETMEKIVEFRDSFKLYSSKKNKKISEFVGLTNYPWIYLFASGKKTKKYFDLDLACIIFDLISSNLYKDYVTYTPNMFDRGFYGSNPYETRELETARYDIYLDLARTFTSVNEGDVVNIELKRAKSWDVTDKDIISYIFTHSLADPQTRDGYMYYEGSFLDLMKFVYPKECDYDKYYEFIANRLRKIFETEIFINTKSQGVIKYELFHDFQIDTVGKKYWVYLGKNFLYALLNKQINAVVRRPLLIEEMENNTAKHLYPTLRSDRNGDLYFNERKIHEYTYIQLCLLVSVRGSKVEQKKEYARAFTELKEKGLLIEDFNCIKGQNFLVRWKDFSEEERADFKIVKASTYNSDVGSLLESRDDNGPATD